MPPSARNGSRYKSAGSGGIVAAKRAVGAAIHGMNCPTPRQLLSEVAQSAPLALTAVFPHHRRKKSTKQSSNFIIGRCHVAGLLDLRGTFSDAGIDLKFTKLSALVSRSEITKMNHLAKALPRATNSQLDVQALQTAAMLLGAALFGWLLHSTYGLDLSYAFF